MEHNPVDAADSLWSEDAFARSLREVRQERGLSQEKLARALNKRGFAQIHQSSIAKIERPSSGSGRRPITLDEALAICQILEVPLHEMVLPPELKKDQRAFRLTVEFFRTYDVVADASKRLAEIIDELRDDLALTPVDVFTVTGNRSPETLAEMADRMDEVATELRSRAPVQKRGTSSGKRQRPKKA